jgi:hypothetical protein
VVWTEPTLPPYVKINPDGEPDPDVELEPGDISMRAVTEEFLNTEEEEIPHQPLTLPWRLGAPNRGHESGKSPYLGRRNLGFERKDDGVGRP